MARSGNGTVRLDILRDRRLRLETKGLYSFLAQMPEDWKFSLEKLAGYVNSSKTVVSNLLRELVSAGYGVMETDSNGNVIFFKLSNSSDGVGIRDLIPISNLNDDRVEGLFESTYGIMKSGERRVLIEIRSKYGDNFVCSALERAKSVHIQRSGIMMYIEDYCEAMVIGKPLPLEMVLPKPRIHNDCQAAMEFLDIMFNREVQQ